MSSGKRYNGVVHTKHLQPLQGCHAENEVLLRQVQHLDLSRDVPHDRLRLRGLLADARHLPKEILHHDETVEEHMPILSILMRGFEEA